MFLHYITPWNSINKCRSERKDFLPAKETEWQNKWQLNEIVCSAFVSGPYNKMWTWLECFYKVYMRRSLIIYSNSLLELIFIRLWRICLKVLAHSNHEKKTPATLKWLAYVANYYFWGWWSGAGFTLLLSRSSFRFVGMDAEVWA